MQEIKIMIDEKTVKDLQTLSIETESRQSLLAFMLNQDMVNHKNFEMYQNEYKDFYFKYAQAKTSFQNKYINPILKENCIDFSKASWSLDFNTNEATITIID